MVTSCIRSVNIVFLVEKFFIFFGNRLGVLKGARQRGICVLAERIGRVLSDT